MLVKVSKDFYRQITDQRTYEIEKLNEDKWYVSVYNNDQGLNEDEAFISKESGNISLITEADEFILKNEQMIAG